MARMVKCDKCAGTGYVSDADDVGKLSPELIHKGVARTFEGIIEDVRKQNPRMSYDEAKLAALNTSEYSELVRAERRARHGF